MTPDEDFDRLPEALRLALLEHARLTISAQRGKPVSLTPEQLAEASSTPASQVHRTCRIALLKLRRRALELES
jgi:hypothetical protein